MSFEKSRTPHKPANLLTPRSKADASDTSTQKFHITLTIISVYFLIPWSFMRTDFGQKPWPKNTWGCTGDVSATTNGYGQGVEKVLCGNHRPGVGVCLEVCRHGVASEKAHTENPKGATSHGSARQASEEEGARAVQGSDNGWKEVYVQGGVWRILQEARGVDFSL